MACSKCGGRGPTTPPIVTAAIRARAVNDAYRLASYPDCTDLYRGPWEGESTYVVARGTAEERLFRRGQGLPEASAYARATKTVLENLPNTQLCRQAVIDVFGS